MKTISIEAFDKKGWRLDGHWCDEVYFKKGDTSKDNGMGAYLQVKGNEYKITVTDKGYNQDGTNLAVKFHGIIENEDEFDMICRMIRLKI